MLIPYTLQVSGYGLKVTYSYISQENYEDLFQDDLSHIRIDPDLDIHNYQSCYGLLPKDFQVNIRNKPLHHHKITTEFPYRVTKETPLIPFPRELPKNNHYSVVLIQYLQGDFYRQTIVPTKNKVIFIENRFKFGTNRFTTISVNDENNPNTSISVGKTIVYDSQWFLCNKSSVTRLPTTYKYSRH